MKNSIKWHENVLKNQKSNLATMAKNIERLQSDYVKQLERVIFHEVQIQEARKFGKDGFDGERFMMKRKARQG